MPSSPPSAAFTLPLGGYGSKADTNYDSDNDDKKTTSPEMANNPLADLPVFDRSDVALGPVLGSGAFCRVCAVTDLVVPPDGDDDDDEPVTLQRRRRSRMVALFEEHRAHPTSRRVSDFADNPRPPPRYAMKFLKSTLSVRDTERGKLDMESELRMLVRAAGHANVITLYALGEQSYHGASRSKFLILDRLRSTLGQRIYLWRDRRGVGLVEVLSLDPRGSKDLWLERMLLLSRLASALSFLHDQGIVYRDLKPENVGFDYDNTPKIFDFGLARTLNGAERVGELVDGGDAAPSHNPHYRYNLTGMTGSPRYMSPEVSQCEPYNASADVYSFAVVAHEVLSLKVPFVHIKHDIKALQHSVNVRGIRPPLDPVWPSGVCELLANMWDGDPTKRPPSHEVERRIDRLLRGDEDELFPAWGVFNRRGRGVFSFR